MQEAIAPSQSLLRRLRRAESSDDARCYQRSRGTEMLTAGRHLLTGLLRYAVHAAMCSAWRSHVMCRPVTFLTKKICKGLCDKPKAQFSFILLCD